jgi:RNase P subunit RPR2
MPKTLACWFGRHEWIRVSRKEEEAVSTICFRCGTTRRRGKSKRTRSKHRGR